LFFLKLYFSLSLLFLQPYSILFYISFPILFLPKTLSLTLFLSHSLSLSSFPILNSYLFFSLY
jgi:hypothetical protein